MPFLDSAPSPIVFSMDPAWYTIRTDKIVADEPTEPNLSCYVVIYENGKFLMERNMPYVRTNKKCQFNVANIANVGPVAPSDASIDSYIVEALDGVTSELQIRFNDMYGDPPDLPSSVVIVEPMLRVVYGGSRYWYGFGPTAASFYLLHGLVDSKGNRVIKELRRSQPEYLYWYSYDGASIDIQYDIIYTDGSALIGDSTAITCVENKVMCLNVGWDSVGMDAIYDPTKTVNLYIVTLGGQEIYYQMDDHDLDDDEYILYDNGSGGCEVLRCSGRHTASVDVEKTLFRKALVKGSNHRDGLSSSYDINATESYTYQTGYYSLAYINHLRLLIAAQKTWYIDRVRQKFYNIKITSTKVNLYDLADDLYSLEFNWEYDQRPSLSNFNI